MQSKEMREECTAFAKQYRRVAAGHRKKGKTDHPPRLIESYEGEFSALLTLFPSSWNTESSRDANTGHCFYAFNPEFFCGLAQFETEMERMIAELTDAPKAPGVRKIYYPGEIEFEKEAEAEKHGVALPPASVEQLRRAAGLAGIPFEP